MGLTIPNTFSDDTVIEAADVNENFSAVASALGSLTGADLSDNAGVTAKQMADRYSVQFVQIALVPIHINATLWAPEVGLDVPGQISPDLAAASTTRLCRFYPIIKAGKRCELVGIAVYATHHATDTNDPKLWVYHNTTLLSGDGVTMVNRGPWYFKNNAPHDEPVAVMTDGDYLEFHLGESGATGTPAVGGLSATLTLKYELES